MPNANLKPEYTYNLDVSVTQVIAEKVTVGVTGFYTLFKNAIIKAPFKLNGQDSIIYNSVKSQVLASQNVNKANIYGFTVDLNATITEGLTISSTLSYTKGTYKTDDTKTSSIYEKQANGSYLLINKKVATRPLDHIPPVMGKTNIAYQHKKFNTEFYLLYNGWKRLNQYNADGEDNAQYATADGMPSWLTANWKANIGCTKNIQLQVGIEKYLRPQL